MIDLFILLTIFALWVIGRERGVIQEIADVAAIIGGFLLASVAGEPITAWVLSYTGAKVPHGLVLVMISIVLFLIGGFLVMVIASAFEITTKKIALEWLNKLLGGLVGASKAVIFWWLIFFLVMSAPISEEYKRRTLESSIFAQIFVKMTPYLFALMKSLMSELQRENIRKIINWKI